MITTPNIWGALRDAANSDVWPMVGTGAPTVTTGVGFAGLGSIYTDMVTGFVYVNMGTKAAPVWISNIQYATGVLLPADIINTAAGKFGHAQGLIMVPAPGANLALQLINVGAYYKFGTAGYATGGNVTVNWGAGGAALTGLISAANFAGAASNKAVFYVPLSTVAIPVVSNASLNLVSSAAFTNGGTAAGTITWECWYRILSVGF